MIDLFAALIVSEPIVFISDYRLPYEIQQLEDNVKKSCPFSKPIKLENGKIYHIIDGPTIDGVIKE
jgi:hypothetical protein